MSTISIKFNEVGYLAPRNNVTLCDNNSFLYSCDARFDFSLLFEQSILSIGPSAILLLVAPLRILQLSQSSYKVRKHPSKWSKILTGTVLSAIQLALLVLFAQAPSSSRSKVSVASAALSFIDALALTLLTHTEHTKSVRPSTIICIYLFVSSAFDAVQCRTLWLLNDSDGLAALFTAMLGVKLIMFIQEIQGKRNILRAAWQQLSPEATSGIFSRGLFWWVNGLMKKGYNTLLSVEGLYATDESLKSVWLLKKLNSLWEKRKADGAGKHALFFSVLASLKDILLLAVFPRLCLTGFKFAQPFLIHRIISYVQDSTTNTRNDAFGLIGATALIYMGIAISMGFYRHMVFRSVTMARGSLVSLIYTKVLKMDGISADSDGSSTLSLTSADTERICSSFENFHEIWASPIEVFLAIWLLEQRLGLACVAPAVVVICCTLATMQLSKFMGPAMKVWGDAIQKRVSTTSAIIASIKEVKLLGLVFSWSRDIQALRVVELDLSKKFRMFIVYMNVLGNAPSRIVPVLTFGIFMLISRVRTGTPLTVATAFTSLSLLELLMSPLAELITSIPSFASSLGCFERMQSFLLNSDRDDYRTCPRGTSHEPQTRSGSEIELSVVPGVHGESEVTSESDFIVVSNGSFGVSAEGPPILKDINISIPRSVITLVVGRVGAGKSILLKGLLGEIHSLSGSAFITFKDVAFCDQQTWLINSSIKDNIVGHSSFDADWYNTVITACALDKDFALLLRGDQLPVGSNGISLSGGQKQRVGLARAIYSRKRIVLVDDVLSGLDWKTQDHIWSRVFGPTGLFRQSGTTVVLATHTLRYLRDADKIIILGGQGEIIDQGCLDDLDQENEYIKTLFVEDGLYTAPEDDLRPDTAAQQALSTLPIDTSPETDAQRELLRMSGDTSLYIYYFRSIGLLYSLGLLALSLAETFCIAFPDVWLRFWAEADEAKPGTRTGMYFGVYAMFAVAGLIIIGADVWFMFCRVTPKSANHLHLILLKTVMNAPLSFFVSTDSGIIINRFSQDMSLIDRVLPSALYMTISAALSCIAGGILIIVGAKYIGVIIPFAVAAVYYLQKFYLRTSRQIRYLDLEAKSPLDTHILETLGGLTTIRAFGWEQSFQDKNIELLDLSQRPFYLLYCIQRWLNLVLDLFVGALAVVLVAMATLIPGATSAGAVGVALINILGFNQQLAQLISSWTSLETSLGTIARLKNLEKDTPTEPHPTHPKTFPDGWPGAGHLKIDSVIASYSPHTEPVLRNISIDIKPGEKIAICGRTGSGKSSLLLSIFRLLEIHSGIVTIDGIDITELAPNTIRSHLIAIPQAPVIFPGSVRFNMSVMCLNQPDNETIIRALKKVGLWVAISGHGNLEPEVTTSYNEILDVDLSSISLSEGQKQLFCLARAIVKRNESRILVLDEAMSSVDRQTEDLMVRVIDEEFSSHTVISVVHKLNTTMGFDRVAVLEAGKVAEIGTPAELLEKEQGIFRALWERSG